MELNDTPKGDRIHISIFGRRNVGKSSIINALTNQNIAIVSDIKGTTTDPVAKAMELLPLGAVMITDTAGFDDDSDLGTLRIQKTFDVLNKTDIAILVIDASLGFGKLEKDILNKIETKNIPFLIVVNKIDINKNFNLDLDFRVIPVCALTKYGIEDLKKALSQMVPSEKNSRIIGDLLKPSDIVVLVTPIDESAPKGRLILPQQQTIRDILDSDAIAIVTKETELKTVLNSLNKKPKLVITDSQVFKKVSADTPLDIPLTSFSILFARHKGDLKELLNGIKVIENLKNGDKILIAEGCTHHRQCEDIGTVKIPKLLSKYTDKQFVFETSSGSSYPENLKDYALIIHCGGCTLTRREMLYRIKLAEDNNIPIVNYGVILAYMTGILERSIELFFNFENIRGDSYNE